MSASKDGYSPANIYGRILRISGRYWLVFLGVAAATAVFAASDTGFAFLVKTLTEIVQAGDELDEQQVFIKRWLPLGVLILFLVRGLSNFLSTYGMGWIARMTVKEIRSLLFHRYLDLPTRFFDENSSGQLLTRLTYHVSQIADAAANVVITLIKDSLTIVFLVVYMVYLSPQLAAFVFLVAPLIALLVRYLGGLFRKQNLKIQTAVGNINRIGEEVLQAHKIVKSYGGQDYERERFEEANERNRRLEMRLLTTKAAGDGITVFITAFGVAGVIFLISIIDIDVPRVAGFITAMVLLMAPIKGLTNMNAAIQRGIAAGESIFSIVDAEAEIDTGTYAPERISGAVEFRNVSFAYSRAKGDVLKGINIKIEPGEMVAIVGRSGSGKSTLVGLLPRFYDAVDGEILIDGVPVQNYTLAALRRQISIVSQEVTLFNDTIAANIAYGSLASTGKSQLDDAVRAAYVDEFTNQLPDKLNTMVGDRGILLSGGQRQRISIARALLKNSPILILDEATSALDTESERHIQSALDKLMQNRTTFVIAHRLSTIEKADRIIVMAAGEIVEFGTHQELLAAGGTYASLYKMQFRDDDSDSLS